MSLLYIILSVVLSAKMDSTSLWIGDQTTIHLEAIVSGEEKVTFPTIGEQINSLLVVDKSPIDTVVKRDQSTIYRQDVVVTAFADSLFLVDELAFIVDGDTEPVTPMALNVIQPFVLDSTEAITDIKAIHSAPIWWWGIIRWILLVLGLVVLGAGGYWLYLRWKKQHDPALAVDPELLRPCGEVALEKLDRIRDERAWIEGRSKQYFTDLTFVIREYIGRRYDIHSTEKTSDDTLQAIRPILKQNDQKELYQHLAEMLHLGDMVKFAKMSPTQEEAEHSLQAAYRFVRETMPQETENTSEL